MSRSKERLNMFERSDQTCNAYQVAGHAGPGDHAAIPMPIELGDRFARRTGRAHWVAHPAKPELHGVFVLGGLPFVECRGQRRRGQP